MDYPNERLNWLGVWDMKRLNAAVSLSGFEKPTVSATSEIGRAVWAINRFAASIRAHNT